MRASDRWFGVVAIVLLGLALSVHGDFPAAATLARPLVTVRPLALPEVVRKEMLEQGETLTSVLLRVGVPARDLPAWVAAAQRFLEVRSLPIGLLAEGVVGNAGGVRAIRLTPDWRSSVVLERDRDQIRARRELRPVEREFVVVQGQIESSLFEAVAATGEDETLAIQLAELFQWDVDFHREVRAGDSFTFLVERIKSEGRTVAYGPIVAAAYINAGRPYTAVRYQSTGGGVGYYDPAGRPLRKQFLRAPLRFSRITSRFSTSRLHPVLGRRLPHFGVDYGAPIGTPVMATGDGVVISVGRKGGGGNAVEIRHPGGYVTAYLHLSRFAAGIRPGARVSQGQTVGYVGTTGLSTGPHLDYRVTRNGAHVNPMTIGGEPAPPLSAAEMPRFEGWRRTVLPLLSNAGTVPSAVVEALHRASPVKIDA